MLIFTISDPYEPGYMKFDWHEEKNWRNLKSDYEFLAINHSRLMKLRKFTHKDACNPDLKEALGIVTSNANGKVYFTKIEGIVESKSAIEIWYNHPCRATARNYTMSPKPEFNQEQEEMLNLWGGIRFPYELVENCCNWELIAPFLNNMRYTYCGPARKADGKKVDRYFGEREFNKLILFLAAKIQDPSARFEIMQMFIGSQGNPI